MRSIALTTFFAVTLLAESAFAQTSPNAAPVPVQQGSAVVQEDGSVRSGDQATNEGRPDPDSEVICRVVQEPGSRLSRRRQRVCGTRTMWEELADQSADAVRGSGANTSAPE